MQQEQCIANKVGNINPKNVTQAITPGNILQQHYPNRINIIVSPSAVTAIAMAAHVRRMHHRSALLHSWHHSPPAAHK